jgi:hypothetical protein
MTVGKLVAAWWRIALLGTAVLLFSTASVVAARTNLALQPRFAPVVAGLDYAHVRVTNKPWSIHIARLDRQQKNLGLTTTLGKSDAQGLGTVSAQVASLPATAGKPLLAINADFFSTRGDPGGVSIRNGELISAPGLTTFWMNPDQSMHIEQLSSGLQVRWPSGHKTSLGLNEIPKPDSVTLFTSSYGALTSIKDCQQVILEKSQDRPWLPLRPNQTYQARVREIHLTGHQTPATNLAALALNGFAKTNGAPLKVGDILELSTDISPNLGSARVAIGGGPLLIKNGKAEPWPLRSASNPYQPRHPRTALGFDARHLFFVVVDGRQANLSIGMSMVELVELLQKLGCTEAMNLDGGGSSTFWLNGKVMNSPSDWRERAVANALIVVEKN